MSNRPLVSVITPTWQRSELLAACIQNVRAQTYRPLEHVIVSDGVDPATSKVALDALDCGARLDAARDVFLRYVVLGRNWSTFLTDSFAAAPMIVGQMVASGDYQTWLADDEWAELDHIQTLVTALEDRAADFAYGRVRMYWNGQQPAQGYDIGADPPAYGQITNVLYRTDLLKRGVHPFGASSAPDWACVKQWLDAGARWAYVNRVTLTHRIDH